MHVWGSLGLTGTAKEIKKNQFAARGGILGKNRLGDIKEVKVVRYTIRRPLKNGEGEIGELAPNTLKRKEDKTKGKRDINNEDPKHQHCGRGKKKKLKKKKTCCIHEKQRKPRGSWVLSKPRLLPKLRDGAEAIDQSVSPKKRVKAEGGEKAPGVAGGHCVSESNGKKKKRQTVQAGRVGGGKRIGARIAERVGARKKCSKGSAKCQNLVASSGNKKKMVTQQGTEKKTEGKPGGVTIVQTVFP